MKMTMRIKRWQLWACDSCKNNWTKTINAFCGYKGLGCALKPTEMQKRFLLALKTILGGSTMNGNINTTLESSGIFGSSMEDMGEMCEPHAENHGPATTIYLRYTNTQAIKAISKPHFSTKHLTKDGKGVIISIDLSLVIGLENDPEDPTRWPLEGFCPDCHGITPTEAAKAQFPSLPQNGCGLVGKGAHWTMSHAGVESEIIRNSTEDQKVCLRALKVCDTLRSVLLIYCTNW